MGKGRRLGGVLHAHATWRFSGMQKAWLARTAGAKVEGWLAPRYEG